MRVKIILTRSEQSLSHHFKLLLITHQRASSHHCLFLLSLFAFIQHKIFKEKTADSKIRLPYWTHYTNRIENDAKNKYTEKFILLQKAQTFQSLFPFRLIKLLQLLTKVQILYFCN